MKARRTHSLMRERFSTINIVEHEWITVADADGLRKDKLNELATFYPTQGSLASLLSTLGTRTSMLRVAAGEIRHWAAIH